MSLLTIAIGIIFVILLFSLLASAIMEMVAGYMSLRGKHLLNAIQNMIGNDLSGRFIQHPFFQQLSIGSREQASTGKNTKARLPAYINSGSFSAILLDITNINSAEEVEDVINSMPESPLKQLLQFLFKQAGADLLKFKLKVEEWFNEVMERASGAYKRHSQRYLLAIGIGLAVMFNADVITIYHNLSVNTTLRDNLANTAAQTVQNSPAPVGPNLDNPDPDAARAAIATLVTENIGALESPLGLGWENMDMDKMEAKDWLYKVIGWLTMALSISLGATFWFDLLKRLVNLRNAGPAPTQQAPSGLSPTTSGSTLTRKEPDSVLDRSLRGVQPAPVKRYSPPKPQTPPPPPPPTQPPLADETESYG